MKLNSIIERLSRVSAKKQACFIIIQPDAVYLSLETPPGTPEKFDISESDWERAFEQALSIAASYVDSISVVLSHNFYQMYQIDKPLLPRPEWATALPFLLKELISERAVDIVADAIELPNTNKVQTYVLPRNILNRFIELTTSFHLKLDGVIPEDDLWGYTAGELGNYLLLQRSRKGTFRISAFVDHTLSFQRIIRSVTAPITGVPSTDMQMDNLALELQRSIDYLSSQLRQVQLHQLKVCCDEEDEAELVQALNYRLSTKVAPLFSDITVTDTPPDTSGAHLSQTLDDITETRLNFYSAHLKPKRDLLTLRNIALSWGGLALVILLSYGYATWENRGIDNQLQQAQGQHSLFNTQFKHFQGLLRQHKPDANKLAAEARLQREIRAKTDSLKAVGQFDNQQQAGYSNIMQSLAKLARRDISISQIVIDKDTLNLKGLARMPSAVPNWVNQFKSEVSLVGRTFDQVHLGRNQDDVVTFELTARGDKK